MHARLSREERRYLERARICRVGSVDKHGQTHVAPLCHALDPARPIAYVGTSETGVTARNLRKRPRAALECDDYYEDWDRLRGVVAHAVAKAIRGGRELERAQRLLKRKFEQYRDTDIDYVIALRIERLTSWGL